MNPSLKPETQAIRSKRQEIPTKTNDTEQRSMPQPPTLEPSRSETTRTPTQNDMSNTSGPTAVSNQVMRQTTRIPDPATKRIIKPSRSILTPELMGPLPLITPTPRPIRNENDLEPTPQIDPNIDVSFHEAQVEALFRAPDMEDFALPSALNEHTKGKQIIAQSLPKQSEIDKLLRQLNKKILTQTRFPLSLKDLEAAYCSSATFKDVYQYLRYNKLPTSRRLAKRVQTNAQDYYVLGMLLFKNVPDKTGDVNAVLCIPPSKTDFILDMYHGTLIGGHQRMNKTLRTLSTWYNCPQMADYIRAYIVGCHICQLFKNSKRFHRPLQKRTYDISQPALANVSMDIKYMPKSTKGNKYLLVILCEITNFLVTHPLKEVTAQAICKVLVEEFIAYFSTPLRIVCDQDQAFMSTLCRYCFQQYKIQILTVRVTNHKSLQAEHGIKSLSNLILTHLKGLGKDWHIYANHACSPTTLMQHQTWMASAHLN